MCRNKKMVKNVVCLIIFYKIYWFVKNGVDCEVCVLVIIYNVELIW